MLEVYATQKAIETLVGSGHNNPNWDKILRLDSCVKVYVDTDEETLNQLMLDNDIELEADSENILEKIKGRDDAVVLRHPVSIYFPSVNVQKASDIQKHFGVICQGESNITDDNYLSRVVKDRNLLPNKHNWYSVVKPLIGQPSNSLVIIDRNLFKDGKIETGQRADFLGTRNMLDFLDIILPVEFDAGLYQILFIIDKPTFKEGHRKAQIYNWKRFSEELKKNINSLRSYYIETEILSITDGNNPENNGYNSSEEWKATHNRYIISNYFYLRDENGFTLFEKDGASHYGDQTVSVKPLFGEVFDEDQDFPIEMSVVKCRKFQKFATDSKYTLTKSNYAHNGLIQEFQGFKNRLIKYLPKERR